MVLVYLAPGFCQLTSKLPLCLIIFASAPTDRITRDRARTTLAIYLGLLFSLFRFLLLLPFFFFSFFFFLFFISLSGPGETSFRGRFVFCDRFPLARNKLILKLSGGFRRLSYYPFIRNQIVRLQIKAGRSRRCI